MERFGPRGVTIRFVVLALALTLLVGAQAQAQPIPSVALDAPTEAFIGEDFSFTASFDNLSVTDVGYGPFIDLVFPVNGNDGAAGTDTPDGIDFIDATYLGSGVNAFPLTFPDSGGGTGCVAHPLAVDAADLPLQVCGIAGDKLVVLQLPFGSFTNDQPAADVIVNTTLSNLADLNVQLAIRARAGFQFGADPLDNPATDPSLLSDVATDSGTWTSNATLTPILIRLTKTYDGPEDETATGPNFPRRYTIEIEIADLQTVTALEVSDDLPNNLAYLSFISVLPGGAVFDAPIANAAANPPDNDLRALFLTITGGAGPDATVVFEYFVPQFDADFSPVIDPISGDDVISENEARAIGDWTPIDTRDPGGAANAVADPVGPEHVLTDKSIAIQKSVAIFDDTGDIGPTPGDGLEYTLEFQISDFFAFQQLVITDVISDGQHIVGAFTPTLEVSEHGVTSSGPLDPANFTVIDHWTGAPVPVAPLDGTTELIVRISDELISRALDGLVHGGCVPDGGTGGGAPDCSVFNGGATTATLVFRTRMLEQYTDDFPSGEPNVDHGDNVANSVTVEGDLLDVADTSATTGESEADDSGAGLVIPSGVLAKSIYAVDGVICAPQPCAAVVVAPDDTLTYRIRYTLPSSDTEQLAFDDYLPLPVLLATEVTSFVDAVGAGPPVAGTAQFGPDDTFRALSGIVPTVSSDAPSNRLRFFYGDFADPNDTPTLVDILFTVTVSDDPFADALFLTNQVRASEQDTFLEVGTHDAIVQFQLSEPVLVITKGVVASDNGATTFSPPTVGPVAFSAPGTAGYRGGATIHSTNLAAAPIQSDVDNVDAGDLVSFAIVVENQGSGLTGAFNVRLRDILPAGLSIPAGGAGLNLTITDGTGAPLAFTPIGGGLFDPAGGIELDDPLAPYHPTTGVNIAIVTFDVILDGPGDAAPVSPEQDLANTSVLTNYAGTNGGPDHTLVDPSDTATVTVAPPQLSKTLVGTEITHANNTASQVVIGEVVTYQVVLRVPEAVTASVTVVDTLDTGLAFVSLSSAVNSNPTDLTFTGSTTPVITNSGRTITFDFGMVSNANTDNSTAETITLVYTVVVLNTSGNQAGGLRNNSAATSWSGGSLSSVSAANVTIIEPAVDAAKSVVVGGSGTSGDAGDSVAYTIVLQNTGMVDAFDVTFNDPLPTSGGASLILGPTFGVVDSAGLVMASDFELVGSDATGWTLRTPVGTSFDMLVSARTITITVNGTLSGAVLPGQSVTNTGAVQWSSLDGEPGQRSTFNANSTERTGADGVAGALNDYADNGAATLTVNNVAPVKSIVSTSEAHTSEGGTGTNASPRLVAIGEIARFRLQVRVPEGMSPNFQIEDLLPNGLRYLNDGTTTVALVSNGTGISSSTLAGAGLAVNGSEATVSGITPTFVLPGAAISGGPFTTGIDPTFSLGDLTNSDSDSDQEFVVIEFNALADNAPSGSNDAGDNRDNSFRVRIDGGVSGPTSNTSRLRIVEPSITNVDKQASPTTGDAGDTITYTITYSSASGANNTTAFDIRLTDTLPADLTLDVGSITAVTGGPFAVNPSAGNTVDVTIASVAAGGSVEITYTATIDQTATAGQTIPNTANLSYTSLPGDNGTMVNATGSSTPGASGTDTGERNGSGSHNDYADNDDASITLVTPMAPSKQITATSEASTDDSALNADPPVAIGEVINYQVTFVLPEGTTEDVHLVDLPAAGLTFIPGSATLDRSSTALSAATDPGSVNSGTPGTPVSVTLDTSVMGELSLALGDVINSDTDDNTGESYVLSLRAVVANVAGNNAGTSLINSGSLRYDVGGVPMSVDTGQVAVHVAEPIVTVTKSADPGAGDAGDTVTFTLTIANTADGTNAASAFDWTFTDTLPPGFENPQITDIDVTAAPAAVANASFTSNVLDGTIDRLDPGEAIIVTYTADISVTAQFGQTLTNIASATSTSLPGDQGTADATPGDSGDADGERNGSGGVNDLTASDDAEVVIGTPTISKTIVGHQSYYAVGAQAQFQITLPVPAGSTMSFVVTDDLPAGLTFDAGSLSAVLPSAASASNAPLDDANATFFSQSGDTLSLDFGDLTVPTAGNIVVSYTVTVANVIANQDGTILTNTATLTFDDADNPGSTVTVGPVDNDLSVRVGEPNLEIEKTITAGAVGSQGGDTVSWQVVIRNDGHTTAYQVDWQDVMPDGGGANQGLEQIGNLTLATSGGDVFLNGTAIPVTVSHLHVKTTVNTGDTLDLADADLPFNDAASTIQMAPGTTVTITFDSVVGVNAAIGAMLNNVTAANYTSLPVGGRDGADGGDDDTDDRLDNYNETASQGLTISAFITIDKTISPSTYTIGEEMDFAIRVDIIQGTTPDLVVTDILPVGLTYVSHAITAGNMSMVFGNAGYATRLGAGQTVRFDFGDVANTNLSGSDNFIAITIRARVDNTLANQNGTVLTNGDPAENSEVYVEYGSSPTRVDFDADANDQGIQGVPIEVIEPELQVAKTVSPSAQSLGDVVTYTITVEHLPSSTADAYDLVLVDTLPAGLTYVAGSATLPPADVTVAGQDLEFRISSLTLLDGTRTFYYQASLDADAVVGVPLTNDLGLTWAGLPGANGDADDGRTGDGGVNDYEAGDSADVTPTLSAFIGAMKQVTLAIDADASSSVTSGDTLAYTVTLTNTNGAATGVVFTDPMPAGATYVAGSMSVNAAPVTDALDGDGADFGFTAAGVLTVVIGPMAASEVVVIGFRVQVVPDLVDGFVVSNQGVVDSEQTVPKPTDEDGDPSNGDQPTDVEIGAPLEPRLLLSKSVALTGDTVAPVGVVNTGDEVTYTIVISNPGLADLTGVQFTDMVPTGAIPAGVTVTGVTTTQGTAPAPSNNVAIGDIGTIAPGGFVTITIAGTVNGTGIVLNTASATTDGPLDAEDSAAFTSEADGDSGSPALDISKTVVLIGDLNGDGQVNPGETIRYVIEVTNIGSSPATGVTITDTLPTDLSLVSVNTTGIVVTTSPTLVVNAGTLPPGGTAVVSVVMTVGPGVVSGTSILNEARATDIEGDDVSDEETFGVFDPIRLSGFVYEDLDNSGVRAMGEPPIAGVTVTLTGTDDLGNPVLRTTVTAVDGSYFFADLRVGTYVITETQPAGYLDGKDSVGSQGVALGADQILTGLLAPGTDGINNNFGELPPSSLAGFVYLDVGDDGVRGAGEPGLGGVMITLEGTDDLGSPVLETTATAADGSYAFTNLRPGTYEVRETQPFPYVDGKDTIGTPGGSSADDRFFAIVLGAGINGVENNFGELATDLTVVKTHRLGSFVIGGEALYDIVVSNVGLMPTIGTVTVTDNLPDSLQFIAAGGGGWNCSAVGQLVTCTHPGPIDPGDSTAFVISVLVLGPAGSVTNVATVSTPGDIDPDNDSSPDITPIRPPAPAPTVSSVGMVFALLLLLAVASRALPRRPASDSRRRMR
jgi:fimbrial isopeptide formation D2 family protein/uncharacterized repeat protein (TIGR01451 family)